jgi:hypothetical protein
MPYCIPQTYQMGQNTKANGPADLYLFKLQYPKIECFGERRKMPTC